MTIDALHVVLSLFAALGWMCVAFLVGYRSGEQDTESRAAKRDPFPYRYESRTEIPEPTL